MLQFEPSFLSAVYLVLPSLNRIHLRRSIGKRIQKIFSNLWKLQKRWISKNDYSWEVYFLLRFSNLIDSIDWFNSCFNTVFTPFPMERHIFRWMINNRHVLLQNTLPLRHFHPIAFPQFLLKRDKRSLNIIFQEGKINKNTCNGVRFLLLRHARACHYNWNCSPPHLFYDPFPHSVNLEQPPFLIRWSCQSKLQV